jgi:hypothetical protein
MIKLDRLTAALATLALASLCVAQRVSAQSTINCGGSSEPAIGATCLVSNNVSVTVPSVARLSINNTNTTLTAPLAAEFAPGGTGHSDPAGPTLTVAANVNWTVTASAGAATWTGGSGLKPSTDLSITNDAGATYHAFPFAVKTGAPTSSSTQQVGYHTNYSFTVDTPGTYTLVVNYTLTSP